MILSFTTYVRDCLGGASAETVQHRQRALSEALDAAVEEAMLPDFVRTTIRETAQTVQALAQERRFAEAADAFAQTPDEFHSEATPSMIAAALAAGARSRAAAQRIWRAMAAVATQK